MNTQRTGGKMWVLISFVLVLAGCVGSATSRSTGELIDDAAITAGINAALLRDPGTKVLDVEVEVYDGRVQLNGVVANDAQRQRAAVLATNVRGVLLVKNNLALRSSKRRVGEYVDDQVLITRVNAALARNGVLNALKIDVEADLGTVYLGGFVVSQNQVQAAADAAALVPGVGKVVNNLELR